MSVEHENGPAAVAAALFRVDQGAPQWRSERLIPALLILFVLKAALTAQFRQTRGIPCQLTVTGEQRSLDPEARLAI